MGDVYKMVNDTQKFEEEERSVLPFDVIEEI